MNREAEIKAMIRRSHATQRLTPRQTQVIRDIARH
jgi:hypothetical protein